MLPKYHIIIGIIFSLLLWLVFPEIGLFNIIVICFSSIFIDFDHYLYFVATKNDFSPQNSYASLLRKDILLRNMPPKEREKYKKSIFIFHGIEFWAIIALLSLFFPVFWFVLIGIAVHMFFDFIELIYRQDPLLMKISQTFNYINNKNKKEFIYQKLLEFTAP